MVRSAAVAVLGLLFVTALPGSGYAGGRITVGDGTPASCTESALKHALLVADTIGGGTVNFKCGPAPVTIPLSQATEIEQMLVLLILPDKITVDGDGRVTLDGTGTATVVFVGRGMTAALKNLSIIGGRGAADTFAAGGIVNAGELTIRKSRLFGNSGFFVGAILNTGTLDLHDSTISSNGGFFFAGGIQNHGTLTVSRSTFTRNATAFEGGGIWNSGTLTIKHSALAHNRAEDGDGGAIANFGTLTMNHSTVSENVAFVGGGVANYGELTAKHSAFLENSAIVGGGIFSGGFFGSVEVKHSDLVGNGAVFGGGIFVDAGTAAFKHSTITENGAFLGAGIFACVEGHASPTVFPVLTCQATLPLFLKHTTVTGNTPDDIFPPQ